jgi:hypothetical protein
MSEESLARKRAFGKVNQNLNYLLPTSFQFSIDRLPFLNNMVQSVTFPSQEYSSIDQPTRLVPVKRPGQAFTFPNIDISFLVDENMESYMEIHAWFRSLKGIDTFDPVTIENNFSDGVLTILNSAKRPIRRVRFKYLFPVSVSGWEFSSSSASPEPITATVSFAYTSFEIDSI